jgi:hypothetical protein
VKDINNIRFEVFRLLATRKSSATVETTARTPKESKNTRSEIGIGTSRKMVDTPVTSRKPLNTLSIFWNFKRLDKHAM